MDKTQRISFPSFEIKDIQQTLDKSGHISTHRILNEYGKYKFGKIYYHPKLGYLQVVAITKMIDISYSPAYNFIKTWTVKQQDQLRNAKKIEFIKLKRVK